MISWRMLTWLEQKLHPHPRKEMLSPSTAYTDMSVKLKVYERPGVREYWMVNPDTGSVFRHTL